jgi:hypothetical protein
MHFNKYLAWLKDNQSKQKSPLHPQLSDRNHVTPKRNNQEQISSSAQIWAEKQMHEQETQTRTTLAIEPKPERGNEPDALLASRRNQPGVKNGSCARGREDRCRSKSKSGREKLKYERKKWIRAGDSRAGNRETRADRRGRTGGIGLTRIWAEWWE